MLLIDLLYELLMQSALLSVYFSIFAFSFGLITLFVVVPRLLKRQIVVRTCREYRLTQKRFDLPEMVQNIFIVWFVRVFKRADLVQELDEDSFSLSYPYQAVFRYKGGEKWKSAYSRVDKSILLSL